MNDSVLHSKYRPKTFKEVLGQDSVVKHLQGVLNRDGSHLFLFSGPSGVGKTTLARICANYVRCDARDTIEIDAASNTGVDDMRRIQYTANYMPLGEGESRAFILDEVHMLSKSAWNSLLKVLEEPQGHVYWFLCTTEIGKVPETIKTRATKLQLSLVADKTLGVLYDKVCTEEKINLPGDIGDMIIREAKGSPRSLLVNLETCREVTTKREAADLLRIVLETDAVLELCRYLSDGKGSWVKGAAILEKLKGENPEGVRIVVSNYFASAALKAKTPREATHFLTILDSFAVSYANTDALAPLLLSVGRVILGGEGG